MSEHNAPAAAPKSKTTRPFVRRLICLIACIVLLQSLDVLLEQAVQYETEDARYDEVTECYAQSAAFSVSTAPSGGNLHIDFAALQGEYPDIAGWLAVDGTAISYPVVKGEDNNYYLHRYLDGTASAGGSIFLDCRCDFFDSYAIVYGHNMKDRSMFGSLREFKKAAFYPKTGGGLTLYTPEQSQRYVIFAVCVLAPDDAAFTPPTDTDTRAALLSRLCAAALYDTGVSVSAQDTVLMLSTCTGKDGAQRLCVFAKETEEN
ncbi:MAG: class B sortase [Faecalibacterium sp.]|nr:class B sortase [Faecalibacterium sp.]